MKKTFFHLVALAFVAVGLQRATINLIATNKGGPK